MTACLVPIAIREEVLAELQACWAVFGVVPLVKSGILGLWSRLDADGEVSGSIHGDYGLDDDDDD